MSRAHLVAPRPPRALCFASLCAIALLGPACAATGASPDAAAGSRSLALLGVGPDVGIKPGGSQRLRVRYTTSAGVPLGGERVRFAIFGDPQGSALLADSAVTSDDGVASVEVSAGASAASFRVRASAAAAADLVFYVEVSSAGFGTLQARVAYDGALAGAALGAIDYWLYKERPCALVTDAQNPPSEAARRRSTPSAAEPVVFKAMAALVSYSLFARGLDDQQRVSFAGCVDLPRTLTRPEQQISVTVRLTDVLPAAAGEYAVTTELLLPGAARPLARALLPWVDLVDCPADPWQLLLDCVLDALDGGDALDCVVEAPGARTAALIAERGMLAADGCRGYLTARGTPALEQLLGEGLQDAQQLRPQLQGLESAALELLRRIDVDTLLTLGAPDAGGALLATHRLAGLTFRVSGRELQLDATSLGVPAPLARAVPARIGGWQIVLGVHALSAGFGPAARHALGELVLAPAQLPRDSAQLAAHLADFVRSGEAPDAPRGCAAIEPALCKAARLGADCLGRACAAGLVALGSYLDRGFAALEQPPSALELGGAGALADDDGDGRVDRIGGVAPIPPASWSRAALRLGGEALGAEQARFAGARLPQR